MARERDRVMTFAPNLRATKKTLQKKRRLVVSQENLVTDPDRQRVQGGSTTFCASYVLVPYTNKAGKKGAKRMCVAKFRRSQVDPRPLRKSEQRFRTWAKEESRARKQLLK